MISDPNVPSLPELLRNLFTYYPAAAIGSLTATVVGTAGVIQTLNTLVNSKIKATNEFLAKQLEVESRRRMELDQKLNEKMEKVALPIGGGTRRLSPVKYIKVLAVTGCILTLVLVPFGSRVRALIGQYAQTSAEDQNTISSLESQLDLVSAPFSYSEILRVLQASPESSHRLQADGHTFDLDKLADKRFVYKGQGPAVLIGSNTKGLLLTGFNGKRFVLLVKAETEAH
jgi:hypothetical protein